MGNKPNEPNGKKPEDNKPNENKPNDSKKFNESKFTDSQNGALQMLSQSEFDDEIKNEYSGKIKSAKSIEELGQIMRGFLTYIAKKLKSRSTPENPREESKKISEGKIDKKHLGKHNLESVGQELFSLKNERPAFRDSKWHKRSRNIRAVCLNKIANGDRHFQNSLLALNQIEEMR